MDSTLFLRGLLHTTRGRDELVTSQPQVYILERDGASGTWMRDQLVRIGILAQWVPTLAALLVETESQPPVVCLVGLRPPANRVLALVADLIQEPRFSQTAFILIGPLQHKRAAFEAGADDYLVTPPDVIELRKRVRLHLNRAELEARLVAENSITQEMDVLTGQGENGDEAPHGTDPITLLEHAAALHQERHLLEQILLHAGSAIALVTPEGTLRYANPAWERLFAPRLPDRRPAFGWPPVTSDDRTTRAIARAVSEARVWQGEVRFSLAGQRHVTLAMTITPAFDATGELEGYVLVQADVRERSSAST